VEDVDLEGTQDVAGPAPGTAASDSRTFELDLTSDIEPAFRGSPQAPPPAGSQAAPQGAGPAGPPDPILERLTRAEERAAIAERTAQQSQAAVAPWQAAMYQQAMAGRQGQDPQALLQKILTDPNASTKDLADYVQLTQAHSAMQQQQLMELTARRSSSEQHARGLFQGDGYDGRDFDAMRTKWVAPVLERVPYLRDVFTALNPEQPAVIEYGFAALLALADRAKDDPRAFYRSLWSIVDGRTDDQAQKIVDAARAAQAHVSPRGTTGRQGAVKNTKVNGSEIWALSDKEFDRLDQDVSGGL
jgi:hypothetical protein